MNAMIYITKENDISVLQLSGRLQNLLRRHGLNTVGKLLEYPRDDLNQVKNMGNKSLNEIKRCLCSIMDASGPFVLVEQPPDPEALPAVEDVNAKTEDVLAAEDTKIKTESILAVEDASGAIFSDMPVSELPLSVRSRNCLVKNGYTLASQLIGLTQEELLSMRNMGQKSTAEVLSFLRKNTITQSFDAGIAQENSALVRELSAAYKRIAQENSALARELSAAYKRKITRWLQEIVAVKEKHPEVQGETLLYYLYDSDYLRGVAKSRILQAIDRSKGILSKAAIAAFMPAHLNNTTILEELLLELENAGAIEIQETTIKRLYPSALTYVSEMKDMQKRSILLDRLSGMTLDEVGQKRGGLTRERIRQIVGAAFRHHPHFREDQYQYLYDTYDIRCSDFQMAFGEPAEVYHYLEIVSKSANREKSPLEKALSDNNILPELRKKAELAVYKNYVTVGGVRVRKRRAELVKYCVKAMCRKKTRYADFLLHYQGLLEELNLSKDSSLILESRTYENILNRSNYVLWNQWKSFRYYDIPAQDYTELLDTINLQQYQNTELSALKFVRDYPELMAQYDIRDEYELHNLLKKIWPGGDTFVSFPKMPTIIVGKPDRTDQMLSLLIQYAPITAAELAQKYEEAYGQKAATVMANYLRELDVYYYNGEYRIDHQNLSPEQFDYMKENLCKPFYLISNVKQLYAEAFPEENPGNINSYTLKTLDFRVFSGYIVKNCYSNASEFFRSLLLADDIVDTSSFDYGISSIVAYSSELYDLRARYQIIEFSPHQYINIRRLNANGITVADFQDYQHSVAVRFPPGEFFTIASLRQTGFSHPLDELGFDEWFYSSILLEDRANFTFQRIGGTRLFHCGTQKTVFADFLTFLVEQRQKIDIYDLVDLLDQQYGIHLSKDKVVEIVSSADLYYDQIMETVYIDYDTYFEEI